MIRMARQKAEAAGAAQFQRTPSGRDGSQITWGDADLHSARGADEALMLDSGAGDRERGRGEGKKRGESRVGAADRGAHRGREAGEGAGASPVASRGSSRASAGNDGGEAAGVGRRRLPKTR